MSSHAERTTEIINETARPKTTRAEAADDCPLCGAPALWATGDAFDMADILRRWEKEMSVKFTEAVWDDYTRPRAPRVTLHRCARCAFAVFRPVIAGTADFYECITVSDGSCYTAGKWEFEQAVKDIRRHNCRRVLDIGSGSGYFLDLLRERLSVEAAGFEFNPEMAALVRQKGHTIYSGSSPEAALSDADRVSFDAVCIFQVLEHVADPVALLDSARRLLKPGGLLVVAVPDNEGPVRHFSTFLTELPPHHVSRWRASTFKIGLARRGFQLLRIAREPLPAYLYADYLPVMLERSRALPRALSSALKKNNRLVRLVNRLGLKHLPGVPGHSIYVAARKKTERS